MNALSADMLKTTVAREAKNFISEQVTIRSPVKGVVKEVMEEDEKS